MLAVVNKQDKTITIKGKRITMFHDAKSKQLVKALEWYGYTFIFIIE